MLVLPVDEAAWGFRVCLYVGITLLVLDVVLPRVFGRRVRLRWPLRRPPRLALPRARPMADDRFRRRRRELEKQIQALERGDDAYEAPATSDGMTTDERDARRQTKKTMKKKKTKRRVKMRGDKTETEGDESEATIRRRAKKRVSFDMTRDAFDESRQEAQSHRPRRPDDEETKHHERPVVDHVHPVERTSAAMFAETVNTAVATSGDSTGSPATTIPSLQAPYTKPSTRPDPFSLVDDDFPWQLPNYARMAPVPLSTVAPSPQLSLNGSHPPTAAPHGGITLNVRRPLGHFNGPHSGASSAAPSEGSTFTLELKHKPFWKRTPTKERTPSPAKAAVRSSHQQPMDDPPLFVAGSVPTAPHHSFVSSSLSHSTLPAESKASEEPRLLFRPDNAFRSSPVPLRTQHNPFVPKSWRVPSPKPPLHSRPAAQAAPAAALTSHISTPVAPQVKLRTPKIIRRIMFDEDMMGALATPSDASPLITESTRKRQRENDVLDALDAVGIPWHKRRLDS